MLIKNLDYLQGGYLKFNQKVSTLSDFEAVAEIDG